MNSVQPSSNTFTLFSLLNSSNVFFSNLKQNTLNANCNLLGIGSAISALDYDKSLLINQLIFKMIGIQHL